MKVDRSRTKVIEKDTREAVQPAGPVKRPDPPGTRRVKKTGVSTFFGEGTVAIVIKADALMMLLQMDEFESSPLGVVRLSTGSAIE